MEFADKIKKMAADGMLCISMFLGHRLKLFDALASVASEQQPATPKQIADVNHLKERYVREWLCCMAAGDIVNVDQSGELFWMRPERAAALCGSELRPAMAVCSRLPLFSEMLSSLCEVFKEDGPLGTSFSSYNGLGELIESVSSRTFKNVVTDVVPLTGMETALMRGDVNVLDVGCGRGFQMIELAKHFPKASFIGIDVCEESIERANLAAKKAALVNAEFIVMDVRHLKKEWTERFDWITMFEACHDQTRPDIGLREIHRVLKTTGNFTMIDINGTGNIVSDIKKFGRDVASWYSISLMCCLPLGSNEKDALCLGAMWGKEKAVQLLKQSGFVDVKAIEPSFSDQHLLYLCSK